MSITTSNALAEPRICGVLAVQPTRLGCAMHNAAFSALKLPYIYTTFDTPDTEQAVLSMRDQGIRGYSVTIPHKQSILPLLDELSPEVKQIGAVNTVINDSKQLLGENTDWYGIIEALKEASVSLKGKKALILGAGGAARAAVYALERQQVAEIIVANRTPANVLSIAENFSVQILSNNDLSDYDFSQIDLLVNSTPLGSPLSDEQHSFDFSKLTSRMCVFDMVTRETKLTEAARGRGATVILGIRMLLHQAYRQFELFAEQPAPKEVMEQALLEEIRKEE